MSDNRIQTNLRGVTIIPVELYRQSGAVSEDWEARAIEMSQLVATLDHGEPGVYILYPDREREASE